MIQPISFLPFNYYNKRPVVNKVDNIQPISNSSDVITFTGSKWPKPDLKQLWDKGKLPTVKYGFYGDKLTSFNITREHLLPKSKGGKKTYDNIVLASRDRNMARSNNDITLFADKQTAEDYLKQWENVKLKELDGRKYIRLIKKTLKFLGLDLDK